MSRDSYLSKTVSSLWNNMPKANNKKSAAFYIARNISNKAFKESRIFLYTHHLSYSLSMSKINVAHALLKYQNQTDGKLNKKVADKIIIKFYNEVLKSGSKIPTKYEKNKSFYESDAWRSLRYEVLKVYGRKCMVCGAVPHPENKVKLHVDHIKPRSKYPELELEFSNLQILCEDCNLGKSNKDSIDYRQHHTEIE